AFLTAGSRSVIAAVRPVEDRTAATLVQHYYAAWSQGTAPPEALRRAQLELRRQDPAADWASFRLLEP
ncbi:MAG: CHAT domain-containing protein, partial [Acidobacteriota bacterium]